MISVREFLALFTYEINISSVHLVLEAREKQTIAFGSFPQILQIIFVYINILQFDEHAYSTVSFITSVKQ